MSEKYLLWSNKHGMWWRARESGYTHDDRHAGMYTRFAASRICLQSSYGWAQDTPAPTVAIVCPDAATLERPEAKSILSDLVTQESLRRHLARKDCDICNGTGLYRGGQTYMVACDVCIGVAR